MRKRTLSKELSTSPDFEAGPGAVQRLAKAAVLPWIALWGWVTVDSVLAYRKSEDAIDQAIEADPITELYDGPREQTGSIKRWLMWGPGSLDRLRGLRKRARAATIGAPLIALAGSAVLLTLARRKKRA
jgi:hypothetical protein